MERVKKLEKDAYDHFGMFGRECRTVMAHCVHSDNREMERIKKMEYSLLIARNRI